MSEHQTEIDGLREVVRQLEANLKAALARAETAEARFAKVERIRDALRVLGHSGAQHELQLVSDGWLAVLDTASAETQASPQFLRMILALAASVAAINGVSEQQLSFQLARVWTDVCQRLEAADPALWKGRRA